MKKMFLILTIMLSIMMTACAAPATANTDDTDGHWVFEEVSYTSYEEAETKYQEDMNSETFASNKSKNHAIWRRAYADKFGNMPEEDLYAKGVAHSTHVTGIEGIRTITVHNYSELSEVTIMKDSGESLKFNISGGEEACLIYFDDDEAVSGTGTAVLKGNSIFVFNAENEELQLVCTDFQYYLEYFSGLFYYVNIDNNLVDQNGNVVKENVLWVESNRASQNTTLLYF